ncbi:MAG TPA: DUF2203 family protein [bacterium]|nr:DUF2203 family protein [bacterium]
MDSKIFSYDEASALLGEVRELTQAAHERLQALRAQVEGAAPGSVRSRKLTEWINTVIHQWAEDIMSLGALPKGLWTVDFDSGKGYYFCWTLNEMRLTHYHNYEEGFMGRKPLSELPDAAPPPLLN